MPSLIGSLLGGENPDSIAIGQNYRITRPSSQFGTRKLVHALIKVYNTNLNDSNTPDGNYSKAIAAIQTVGEILAVGYVVINGSDSELTVIFSDDTLSDDNFSHGDNGYNTNAQSTNLDAVLSSTFGQSVDVSYNVMVGFGYD